MPSRFPDGRRLIARTIALVAVMFFFQVVVAQNVRISVEFHNIPLKEALKGIEKKCDYTFLYSDSQIDINRKVSLTANNEELKNILSKLLHGATYVVNNKRIILTATTNKKTSVSTDMKHVTGTVKDQNGDPLMGATVRIKGTDIAVATDLDGLFNLQAPQGSSIEVTYIGCRPYNAEVIGDESLSITMTEDDKLLEEVVVVGYGTQKKVNLTGSVGMVNTAQALKARSVTNVQELLAGTVPGLVVSKGSGAVGSGASINIHGTSTIGGSSGVLVLIDGVPGNIYTLNPNDIESVSVLKDAASAAIYGSRAANGVMLITTKQAVSNERPTVEVSSSVGLQNPQFKIDFVGAEDYMKLYDEALMNDGKDAYFGEQGIKDLKAGKYADNKWYKKIYRKNTLINNSHLAISGQERVITYRFAISNDYQEGTLPNNKYDRLVFKPYMHFQILKNLDASVNMQYTQTNIHNPQGGTTIWQTEASRISPITPIYTANGQYGIGSSMSSNPIAGVNESGFSKERHKEMLAIFTVGYSPLNNWNIKGVVSAYTHDNTTKNRAKTYYLYNDNGDIAKTMNPISGVTDGNSYNYRTQIQFTTDYSLSLREAHNFKFLAGYSQEYYKTEGFWASREELPFADIDVIGTGSTNKQNGNYTTADVAVQSWFGRVNYDYKARYLFEASIRGDGSSRFAKGHRWGVFPSLSAGWNIQREEFMEQFVNWLSELKIRGSWGKLGDAEKVGYYPTAQVLSFDPKVYTLGGKLVGGAWNSVSINPNITWEVSELANIGLDFGFLNQRIKFSVDYFSNLRKNILYRVPVPTEFGLSAPISNLLRMRNHGMDFMVSYNDAHGDFAWGIDANASFSKNKVLDLGDTDKWIEGNVITYLNDRYQLPYGYEAEGLFQSEEDIENHAKQGNVMPGNIKFKDIDGNGTINGDDRVVLNRKVPINVGANLHFSWKGLDCSVNMYGRFNVKRYISSYEGWAFYLSQNARPMHLDAWCPDNPDATYPRLTLTNTSNDTQYNSYWLRKADYWKIQNAQIGYTFPTALLAKANIKYLRVFISGQNLATITGYDGFDPEGGYYPLSRTYSFGLNLKF